MTNEALDQFVDSWGSMGALWGVNRSMARIHALLIVSEEPLSLDDITQRLGISRGNASMCLKELRNWRVVHRVHLRGQRRDYYVTESDVWSMFFRILLERKRREFDPALATVREALGSVDENSKAVADRLGQMEDLLGTINRVMSKLLADEESTRSMLRLLTMGLPGEPPA